MLPHVASPTAFALSVVALVLPAAGCGSDAPPIPRLPDGVTLDAEVRAEIEAALRAAEAAPSDAEARFAYAARLDANGLARAALEAYQGVLALDPDHARAHYHAARAHAELGEQEAAAAALERALREEPGYAPGHRRLGLLLLDLGELAKAESELRRAHELAPRDPGAPLGLARLELERGDAEAALRLAESVLAAAPDLAYAHHLRACALREAGRVAEAAAAAERADGRAPEWDDPWEREVRALHGGPRMRLARARALLTAGRTAEAVALLEREMGTRPDDVGVLGTLAAGYTALGRFDDALALLTAAAERQPRHNRIPLLLSEVHAARGDLAAAVASARHAIELQPDFALAHERMALLLEAAGQPAEARRSREMAAQLGGVVDVE